MRALGSVAIAIVLVLAFAVPVTARPYVVKVFGMAGWTDTYIPVSGGDHFSISSKGFVMTASIRGHTRDGEISGSGPAGQAWNGPCEDAYQYVDTDEVGFCGVDSAFFGELIAKAGATTWAIGDATEIVVPDGVSGTLLLAANDFMFTSYDNQGSFSVSFH